MDRICTPLTPPGRKLGKIIIRTIFLIFVFMFLCEYAIYPLVLYQCSWPSFSEKNGKADNVVKAMFLADTHLLGPYQGHWFDKLRREWQMRRAFQSAIFIFEPEVVFFLGDLFDEGEFVNAKDFEHYVSRFEYLFSVPSHIEVYVVAGNHDMGYHYKLRPRYNSRFRKAFNTTSVRLVRLKETNFVLINSMAMEMDNCFLCREALLELSVVEDKLLCQEHPQSSRCLTKEINSKNEIYSRPILLQHYPLYRQSDSACTGDDSASDDEKNLKFRQRFDCLSKDSSEMLLYFLKPSLALSGHTHNYCLRKHTVKNIDIISEYSLASFSWRNRNNPSFFLGHFSGEQYQLSKCYMPKESTVFLIYGLGLVSFFFLFLGHFLSWSLIRRCFIFFARKIFKPALDK